MIIWDISPVAFTIGSFSVRWYGIFVALAVLFLIFWALRAVRKGADLSYETVFNAALVGIPSGIIFSRLLHVIDLWEYYSQNPWLIISRFGEGLTIWGAVLGAALGIWIYSRFSKFSFGYLADILAPGVILAQAIGRVGCTFNGCCYGVGTTIPCAITYTNQAFGQIIGPVHPTQIYEIVYNLIIFVILIRLKGHFRPDGSIFLFYLTFYSLWRLGIDFIRDGTSFLFGLHEAQVISIIVLIITITLMALRTRWVKKEESSIESGEVGNGFE